MPNRPLEGYRVVDFGWVMAGPILGHLLADMGAEVIKIESRQRLDAARRGRPIIGEQTSAGDAGEQFDLIPLFHAVNRGKLSITVDLSQPKSAELIKRVVSVSDVVTENFSPSVLEKMGLDYKHLARVNPSLIMVSLYAAGEYGPLRDIRTYAPSITSLSGMDSLVGYPGEDLQSMIGLNFADPNAGLIGFVALLAALYHRKRTGTGQNIDVSQWEATTALVGQAIMDYTMNGRTQKPQGNHHPGMAPYGNYPCTGEDKWVSIAVRTEEEWQAFCSVIGDPAWTNDARFTDTFGRIAHRSDLDKLVAEWTSQHSQYEVMELLQREGVAAMPVMSIDEQFVDPHYRERETYVEIDQPLVGVETIYGLPWRLSETPGEVNRPAPMLGQHNQYIFGELLGLSEAEIAQLIEEQVIF